MATTERKPSAVGISARDRVNLLSNGLSGTNLERGSSHNLRVTLQAIRLNAPVTKVELAEITGLTPPSITNITRKLFADGLIIEAGRRRGERGQPALKLAINPDGAFSIGVNVDRDHMTLVALDFLGDLRLRIVENIQFPMPDQVRDFVSRNLAAMRASGEIDMTGSPGSALPCPTISAASICPTARQSSASGKRSTRATCSAATGLT
jgi:DNA-binding Lrp family transcriptional regulator